MTAEVDHLGPPVLASYSLGADLTVHHAAAHPGAVAGLVLIDGANPVPEPFITEADLPVFRTMWEEQEAERGTMLTGREILELNVEIDGVRARILDRYRQIDVPIRMIMSTSMAGEGEWAARLNRNWRAGVERLIRELPRVSVSWLADIDRRLLAEIRERRRHRRRIAQLACGDDFALPPQVTEYLGHLRSLGVDERIVRLERDGWIPLAARSPERVPEWLARKREQMADSRLVDVFLTLGQALEWSADDPRLAGLADDLAAYLARAADERGEDYIDDVGLEPAPAGVMDSMVFDALPPARRLVELLRQRGWTGWTKLERDGSLLPRNRAGSGGQGPVARPGSG
ncbi:alpha/beta fold hydrolase [Nonomuraea typhae]|uniref:Alpha/beta fold hydrolase n=1 Tax=Nonomuraea typhae TaxID=2603600 RepID=A0ABW7ZBN6_9ACTN